MENKIKITLANLPDKKKVVAELSYENEIVAVISQETGPFVIDLHPKSKQGFWRFTLAEFLSALQEARQKLVEE